MLEKNGMIAFGAILRDQMGNVVAAWSIKVAGYYSTEELDALAYEKG